MNNTRSGFRGLAGLFLGAAVGAAGALLLALFMYTLISTTEMSLNDSRSIHMLDFVRLKREESAQRKDRKPERPQQDTPPEIPPDINQSSAASGDTLAVMAPSTSGPDLDIGRGGLGIGTGDGEYLPIVKVAPVYPRKALQRGMAGECLVRYTVTTAGTVKDIEVVEDQCTDSIFYKPSIEAARRFKYKPRVIDGVAIEVMAVYNRFTYELDDKR